MTDFQTRIIRQIPRGAELGNTDLVVLQPQAEGAPAYTMEVSGFVERFGDLVVSERDGSRFVFLTHDVDSTPNAMKASSFNDVPVTAVRRDDVYCVVAQGRNTSTQPTLSINGLLARQVRNSKGQPLGPGRFGDGDTLWLQYDPAGFFRLLARSASPYPPVVPCTVELISENRYLFTPAPNFPLSPSGVGQELFGLAPASNTGPVFIVVEGLNAGPPADPLPLRVSGLSDPSPGLIKAGEYVKVARLAPPSSVFQLTFPIVVAGGGGGGGEGATSGRVVVLREEAGSTGTAFVASSSADVVVDQLRPDDLYWLQVSQIAADGAPTLAIDGLPAVPIYNSKGNALGLGRWRPSDWLQLKYDADGGHLRLIGRGGTPWPPSVFCTITGGPGAYVFDPDPEALVNPLGLGQRYWGIAPAANTGAISAVVNGVNSGPPPDPLSVRVAGGGLAGANAVRAHELFEIVRNPFTNLWQLLSSAGVGGATSAGRLIATRQTNASGVQLFLDPLDPLPNNTGEDTFFVHQVKYPQTGTLRVRVTGINGADDLQIRAPGGVDQVEPGTYAVGDRFIFTRIPGGHYEIWDPDKDPPSASGGLTGEQLATIQGGAERAARADRRARKAQQALAGKADQALVEVYDTPGDHLWTRRPGARLVEVHVFAGGGGGGGGGRGGAGLAVSGGGGGAGGCWRSAIFPADTLTETVEISVGAGGAGGASAATDGPGGSGVAGFNSRFGPAADPLLLAGRGGQGSGGAIATASAGGGGGGLYGEGASAAGAVAGAAGVGGSSGGAGVAAANAAIAGGGGGGCPASGATTANSGVGGHGGAQGGGGGGAGGGLTTSDVAGVGSGGGLAGARTGRSAGGAVDSDAIVPTDPTGLLPGQGGGGGGGTTGAAGGAGAPGAKPGGGGGGGGAARSGEAGPGGPGGDGLVAVITYF